MIDVEVEHRGMNATAAAITLRTATAADSASLARLAALDSQELPAGNLVVAEREGHLVAAVDVATLAAVADPFERTDHVVGLLRRDAVARRNARPARRHFRLVPHAA
jgi:hypothetical protein